MSKSKVYKAKTLIAGHRINKDLAGKVIVAVPEKQVNKGLHTVAYGNLFMRLPKKPVAMSEWFQDHYGRGTTYRLCYYVWLPGSF